MLKRRQTENGGTGDAGFEAEYAMLSELAVFDSAGKCTDVAQILLGRRQAEVQSSARSDLTVLSTRPLAGLVIPAYARMQYDRTLEPILCF